MVAEDPRPPAPSRECQDTEGDVFSWRQAAEDWQSEIGQEAHRLNALSPEPSLAGSLGRWRIEGVQGPNVEACEVIDVPRNDNEVMNMRRRSDHGVFRQAIVAMVHKLGPLAKNAGVNRPHFKNDGNPVEPCLDLGSLCSILFARNFDTRLDLADGHGGKLQGAVWNVAYPGQHGAVRPCSA